MTLTTYRAFCKSEFLAMLVVILAATTMITVVFGGASGEDKVNVKTIAAREKDALQMRSIHQSWIIFAREFNGLFPRPGLINRLADENGRQVPGRGPEDKNANTTANLYSVMVMANYCSPDTLISPVERSPKVKPGTNDYDYTLYNATGDVYWDPNFKADLTVLSHVSYAHMPIHGQRVEKQWRDSLDLHFAVIGNRGPKDGLMDHTSITCGPHGNWAGNIVFNDNHYEFCTTTVRTRKVESVETSDNFFAAEGDLDIILAFTRKFTDKGPELQFD